MSSCTFLSGGHFSHVRGFGINDFFKLKFVSEGLVGQIEVRKAAKIIVEMFEKQDFQGGGVVIIGSVGTGKTTFSMALCSSIPIQKIFLSANSAEIYSPSLSKIENLTQLCRKGVGVTFFEENLLIFGRVVNLNFYKNAHKKNQNIYGKITIRNKDFQSVYEIGSKTIGKLVEKKIRPGDLITLNRTNGEVKKTTEVQFSSNKKFFKVQEKKNHLSEIENYTITEHSVSFHELDILNYYGDLISNFFTMTGGEIPGNVRESIDRTILDWVSSGKVKLTRGFLFIDDIHIFDPECFSFLGKSFESILSPFFIFTVNGLEEKTSNGKSFHFNGIPLDFLDRLLIIPMKPNTYREIMEILKLKLEKTTFSLGEKSLHLLTKIALECGIHYSIYIMNISSFLDGDSKKKIHLLSIKRSFFLFVDCKRFIRFSSNLKTFFFGFGKGISKVK